MTSRTLLDSLAFGSLAKQGSVAVEFTLIHPQFTSQHAAVVKAAALRGCAAKVNEATLPKVNGRYTVFNNEGRAGDAGVGQT